MWLNEFGTEKAFSEKKNYALAFEAMLKWSLCKKKIEIQVGARKILITGMQIDQK